MLDETWAEKILSTDKERILGTAAHGAIHKRTSGGLRRSQRSFLFKNGIKSKSLDIFDRPGTAAETSGRRSQLKRYRSLASIPEHSVQTEASEDDLVVHHRSPVSLANGYRPVQNYQDTSSSLEKVSVRRLTSYQNNQNNECESSEKGLKPTSPCLESAVKFCLFLFLIVLLVYHVSNLFKTEMFELDTCDNQSDNQSNNLFIC